MPPPKPAGIAEADHDAASAIAAPANVINKNLCMFSLLQFPQLWIEQAPDALNRA